MGKRVMNLDLTCEFLACFSASQVGLGHHLQGPCLVLVVFCLDRLDSLNFIALGKSSLAKEASLHVLDVAWSLAFRQLPDFLFNDLRKTTLNKRVYITEFRVTYIRTVAVVSAARLLLLGLGLRLLVASCLDFVGMSLFSLLLVSHHGRCILVGCLRFSTRSGRRFHVGILCIENLALAS